ncbi:S-layer homology domain-containing protein [Firmicutes bacterium AF36-3BH]|nr:S-layer homology domain-containing protein [Firmicutes bacterium AF36-3BH]
MENFEWAKEAVEYLYKEGIVHGTGDSKFSPQDNVTREQFTKMIVEFSGLKGDTDFAFDDVLPDTWYYDYIKTAYSTGIISGISDNLFGTGNSMTREDAVVVIARCMNIIGIDANDEREYSVFFDENEIADYAKNSVELLYKKGIINGMDEGIFAPKAMVTRAQAAKMIYELCKVRRK